MKVTAQLYKAGTGREIRRHDRVALQYYASATMDNLAKGVFIENTFDADALVSVSLGDDVLLAGLEESLIGARVGSTWRVAVVDAELAPPPMSANRELHEVYFEIFIQAAVPVSEDSTFAAWFRRVSRKVENNEVITTVSTTPTQRAAMSLLVEATAAALRELEHKVANEINARQGLDLQSARQKLEYWRRVSTEVMACTLEFGRYRSTEDWFALPQLIEKIDAIGQRAMSDGWTAIRQRSHHES